MKLLHREYTVATKSLKNQRQRYKRSFYANKLSLPISDEEKIYAKIEAPTQNNFDVLEKEKLFTDKEILPLSDNTVACEDDENTISNSKRKKIEIFEQVSEENQSLDDVGKLINADGYYDEILPLDHGEKFKKPRRIVDLRKLLLAAVLLFLSIAIIVFSLK